MKGYNDRFYQNVSQNASAARTVSTIVQDLVAPRSIVDFGCGVGAWAKAFADAGIEDYLGIDGDWVQPAQLMIPLDKFTRQDLTKDITLPRKYDMALCLEVAEHLPSSRARGLVRDLTAASDVILFSAAIPFQGGTHHVNEQWPEYWVELFASEHFLVVDCLRKHIWKMPEMRWFYAQNLMLFVRREALDRYPKLKHAQQFDNLHGLSLVHPHRWTKQVDPKKASLRNTLRLALRIARSSF